MARRAGVLIPLFSIRTPQGWGLGEIPDLVPFARWAAQAGCAIVQLLPVNQPSGGQNSPYSACTAFALDPAYLSLSACADFVDGGGEEALPGQIRETLGWLRTQGEVRWKEVREVKQGFMRGGKAAPMSLGDLETKFVDNAIYGGWVAADADVARGVVTGLFETAGPKRLRDLRH